MNSFRNDKRKEDETTLNNAYPFISVNKDSGNDRDRIASTERMTIQRAARTSMGFRSSTDERTMNPSLNFNSEVIGVQNLMPYSAVSEKEIENTLSYNPNRKSFDAKRKGERSNSVISMRDITPEIAAQVVKNYLLPMFDSDSKQRGKHKGSFLRKEEVSIDSNQKPKTIYGELKLSDQLISQIDELK